MNHRIILPLLSLLAIGRAAAYSVQATVVTADGEGVAYATYRIKADGATNPSVSNTTNINGLLEQQLSEPGHYSLTLSYVGLTDTTLTFEVTPAAPTAILGRIEMHEASEALAGITVTAQKPLVVRQIDRLGYDVQADPAVATSSVRDIMRKVPMVSVKADGTILVNGSTNFKIYRNGRPNNTMSRNAKDLFGAMPASTIKRIEVITEPGAEYDAEGTTAILNIVTLENTVIKGVMGTAGLEYTTDADLPGANLWLTSQVGKVTLSAFGGYGSLSGKQMRARNSGATTFPDGSQRSHEARAKYKGDLTYFGLEGSYELDSLNLFTADVAGYYYNYVPRYYSINVTETNSAGAATGGYFNTQTQKVNGYFDINASFNYQHSTRHRGETLTLSYLLSTTRQHIDTKNYYEDMYGTLTQPYSAIFRDYKLRFIEHTFQADWNRPLGKHLVNTGAKWIIRRNRSTDDAQYIGWQDEDSEFKHITNIAAVYAQYGISVGKVNLRAGLRYEYSHLKAEYPDGSGTPFSANLSDLVPSAAASWQMSDASSLSANYSASIARPGISYLNPAVNLAPGSVSSGNPDLESARRQSVKLQYMLIKNKLNFNFSVNYAFANNGIATVRYLTEGDVVNSTYANIGHTRNLNFNTFVQWSPFEKTSIMLNGGVGYERASQSGLTISRWCPDAMLQVTQQLPWKLGLEGILMYWGGHISGVYGYSSAPFVQCNWHAISLRRDFLKDNRLSVRITADNIFGPSWRGATTYTTQGDYRSHETQKTNNSFRFRISVSYRFGSLNASVKKTSSSIKNDDLEGRKL